jgi:predicted  nucleic acid-binding Zn-ribbon protein
MSLVEWGLLFGVLANGVGLLIALLKVVAWISSHIATINERLNHIENQVNNDITGRKVVGEMRQDIAVIKTQITDIRDDLKALRTPLN